VLKEAFLADPANAAVHMTVVREGVSEAVADNTEIGVLPVLGKEGIEHLERVVAVVIISIDNAKGFVYLRFGNKNGMARAPGLLTTLRNREACRQVSKLLENIVYLYNILEPPDESLLELLLDITPYDEYNLAKPCPLCIIN